MIYKLLSLPLGDKEYHEELDTIKYIAVTNGYDVDMVNNILREHKKKHRNINGHKTRENTTRKYIATPYTPCLLYTSRCV